MAALLVVAACTPRAMVTEPAAPHGPLPPEPRDTVKSGASGSQSPPTPSAFDERVFGDPTKGGLIGRMALADSVSGEHSVDLFYYQVGFELPEGITLQRQQSASHYMWQAPGKDHLIASFDHYVPVDAGPSDEVTSPARLAQTLAGPFFAAVGDGTPILCSGRPELRGYEWQLRSDRASLWLVIVEYEDPHPRPDGFRSFMGAIYMVGARDSPFALDGDVVRRVRDSIRVTSMFDPKLVLRLGPCAPEV